MFEIRKSSIEESSTGPVPVVLANDTAADKIVGVQRIPAQDIHFTDDPNREASAFSDESFDLLTESIDATKGNTQPVEVRVRNGPDGSVYELISGHRRVRACHKLGLPVLALVTEDLDDRSAFVHRLAENVHRQDLSPWERGRQIEQGFVKKRFEFESQAARMLGTDKSDLSKLRRLGRLDARIVAAFRNPSELQFRHAKPLTDAVMANPNAVLAEADRISGLAPKLEADAVVALLSAAGSVGRVGPSHTRVPDLPLSCEGTPVGRIRVAKDNTVKIELDVPIERKEREQLAKAVEAFVRRRVLKL